MIATDTIHIDSTTLVRSIDLPMYTKALVRESWRFLQPGSTISVRNIGPSGFMDQLVLDEATSS